MPAGNILANTRSSRSSDTTLHHPSGNGLLYEQFPGLSCFTKLTADKHVLAELLLVPVVIYYHFDAFDSWCLYESEIPVQGNQRFFLLAASRLVFAASRLSHEEKIKKNLWDQGNSLVKHKENLILHQKSLKIGPYSMHPFNNWKL